MKYSLPRTNIKEPRPRHGHKSTKNEINNLGIIHAQIMKKISNTETDLKKELFICFIWF